eukprot:jgi/Mesen1/6682/ME000343S05849
MPLPRLDPVGGRQRGFLQSRMGRGNLGAEDGRHSVSRALKFLIPGLGERGSRDMRNASDPSFRIRKRGAVSIIFLLSVGLVGALFTFVHNKGAAATANDGLLSFPGKRHFLSDQNKVILDNESQPRIKPTASRWFSGGGNAQISSTSYDDATVFETTDAKDAGADALSQGQKKKKYTGPLVLMPKPGEEGNRGRIRQDGSDTCDPQTAPLRLYMYDLPGEFNFGIQWEEYNARLPANFTDIPRYLGGMYQQHSPEYWMTVDLLTSDMDERQYPCVAVRVRDPQQADMIFVPFFASLSYNKYTSTGNKSLNVPDRNEELQNKLVEFLLSQELWKKSQGRDHILVIHHPNSMHVVRDQLGAAMFVLADFGRYNHSVANMDKDVIAPYKHVIPTFANDTNGFAERPVLLFFQGMIVRKEREGIRSATQGMRTSRFCLHLAGDTPSSNRLFDAIVSHCVPVIISDEIELPFEDFLDYSEFCIFVKSHAALVPGHLMELLRGVTPGEWTRMWERLKEVEHHFEYWFPSRPDDATHMTWKAIARKAPLVKLTRNRSQRYRKSMDNLVFPPPPPLPVIVNTTSDSGETGSQQPPETRSNAEVTPKEILPALQSTR